MARILSIVAAALSVLAVVIALTRSPAAPEPAPEAKADRTDRADDGDRWNSVEQTLANLVRRVEALERAPRTVAARPGEPAAPADPEQRRKELEALRSDVDALLTGEALGTEEGRKRFKELVREAQDEVFSERTRERVTAREEERAVRLKKFFEEARLSQTQQQDLSKLLDEEAAKRRTLQGQRTPQTREEMAQLRKQTDDAARRLLDNEQAKQYDQMRHEERRDYARPGGFGRIRLAPNGQEVPAR